MFSFYKVILDLIKARTHKYIRRVPIGATHTGSTKYKYYYQEQAGHGKGLGHESELVKDASFAFGEGENRYHVHIKSVDGDKLTIEYDDGDKKGQKETLSKTELQNRIHKEHATSIKQAHEKAKKQLATFEKMKEKGAKVKDSTLNKLKAQVEKLDSLETKKPETPQNQRVAKILDSVKTIKELDDIAKSLSNNKNNVGVVMYQEPMLDEDTRDFADDDEKNLYEVQDLLKELRTKNIEEVKQTIENTKDKGKMKLFDDINKEIQDQDTNKYLALKISVPKIDKSTYDKKVRPYFEHLGDLLQKMNTNYQSKPNNDDNENLTPKIIESGLASFFKTHDGESTVFRIPISYLRIIPGNAVKEFLTEALDTTKKDILSSEGKDFSHLIRQHMTPEIQQFKDKLLQNIKIGENVSIRYVQPSFDFMYNQKEHPVSNIKLFGMKYKTHKHEIPEKIKMDMENDPTNQFLYITVNQAQKDQVSKDFEYVDNNKGLKAVMRSKKSIYDLWKESQK